MKQDGYGIQFEQVRSVEDFTILLCLHAVSEWKALRNHGVVFDTNGIVRWPGAGEICGINRGEAEELLVFMQRYFPHYCKGTSINPQAALSRLGVPVVCGDR